MTRKNFRGTARANWCACLTGGFAITGLALATLPSFRPIQDQSPETRKSTQNPVRPTGKLGQDIFLAIDHRDVTALQALLKAGGDPNSRNGLGFAPLYIAAASHQPDAVDALLKAGAKPDLASTYGTPLMFACATNNVPDAMRFLSLGANPKYQRTDGLSPLMEAAHADSLPLVQELMNRKVDVNAQDDGGYSALTIAARDGSLDVASALVAGGANLEVADENRQTPLMTAAMTGHADVVKMLIDKGAKVNAVDASGRSALVLTASYGDYPDVIHALLDAKADAGAKDKQGHTAGQLATARGFGQSAAILTGAPSKAEPMPTRTAREAVALSLNAIQASTKQFAEGAPCVSCHQEGLGRMVTGEAMAKGFKLDSSVQSTEQTKVLGMLMGLKPLNEGALHDPEVMKQIPLIEINEVSTSFTWILSGLIDQKQPASDATAAMTMVLARQQSPDGCWTFSLPRTPMQSSYFTFTALSVRAMNAYGPKADSAEIAQRLGKARQWFVAAPAKDSEDRASKLLGLKWTDADAKALDQAAADVVADQRADGGWSQMPNQQSDAYATGQALYALRVGGMAANNPVYKKGVRFLLLTQDSDGSWFVNKRAIPANNYFDAGFPHGESQFSSFNGTCWATLALLGAV